jgi:S-adenosylmethionine:tRNA ribosyltransferase-isomerase
VTVDDLDAHPMHEEHVEVGRDAVDAITRAKRENRAIVAIGTTVVRAIEAAARQSEAHGSSELLPFVGATKLLIQPGDRLRVVDALLTNFHLPKSTLLALVGAFIGVEHLRAAYAHAIDNGYRFYSYGDAMLIPRTLSPDLVKASVDRAVAQSSAKQG